VGVVISDPMNQQLISQVQHYGALVLNDQLEPVIN